MASKNETTNSSIHQFKVFPFCCCTISYQLLSKTIKPCFFILETFCSTPYSWIGEFVVSVFDVTNRLIDIFLILQRIHKTNITTMTGARNTEMFIMTMKNTGKLTTMKMHLKVRKVLSFFKNLKSMKLFHPTMSF